MVSQFGQPYGRDCADASNNICSPSCPWHSRSTPQTHARHNVFESDDSGRVTVHWLFELCKGRYGASCRVVSMTRGENLELIYPTDSDGCRKDKKNADITSTGSNVVFEVFIFSDKSPLTYLFSKSECRAARKRPVRRGTYC